MKQARDLFKIVIKEGATMLSSILKNKEMAEPSDAEILKEQALQVEATVEAILNNVEGIESAT